MTIRKNPPRNGEGDRGAKRRGGGAPEVLQEPIKTVRRARQLRKEMSLPEVLLWQELRRRPGGYKFRRQFPQIGYAVDFACLQVRLAVEVDGETHNRGDRPDRDAKRDQRLDRRGFATLRIPAAEVLGTLEGVISGIVEHCRARGPLHPSPSASGPPPRSGEDLE